jgi:NADPH-dependent glutamate synthase beta subunit-like oxidoreductase
LREFLKLPDVNFRIDSTLVSQEMELHSDALKNDRAKKRMLELLQSIPSSSDSKASKSCTFSFLKSPKEIKVDESNHVKSIVFEDNILENGQAKGTGSFTKMHAELLVKSIGYQSERIKDVPWDAKTNTVPNNRGFVSDGLYVSGWLKTGPKGTIATSLFNAQETAERILEDYTGKTLTAPPQDIFQLLKNTRIVDKKGWDAIDRHEISEGDKLGKPREKITNAQDMHDIASGVLQS